MQNLKPETFSAQPVTTEITPAPLDALVGYMALEFNELEFKLQNLLQILLETDHDGATAVWSSLMWGARVELVDALLNARFRKGHIILQFWSKRLKGLLSDVASDRNAVVHGTRLIRGTEHFITHNHLGDHAFSRRRFCYDEQELREIILDIRLATHIAGIFAMSVFGNSPAPEELACLSVRRRLPRKQREHRKD